MHYSRKLPATFLQPNTRYRTRNPQINAIAQPNQPSSSTHCNNNKNPPPPSSPYTSSPPSMSNPRGPKLSPRTIDSISEPGIPPCTARRILQQQSSLHATLKRRARLSAGNRIPNELSRKITAARISRAARGSEGAKCNFAAGIAAERERGSLDNAFNQQ